MTSLLTSTQTPCCASVDAGRTGTAGVNGPGAALGRRARAGAGSRRGPVRGGVAAEEHRAQFGVHQVVPAAGRRDGGVGGLAVGHQEAAGVGSEPSVLMARIAQRSGRQIAGLRAGVNMATPRSRGARAVAAMPPRGPPRTETGRPAPGVPAPGTNVA